MYYMIYEIEIEFYERNVWWNQSIIHKFWITGGDINENEVHPGVAIYFKGADIGAIVSTGNWTWKVEVLGQRPLAGTVVNIPLLKHS